MTRMVGRAEADVVVAGGGAAGVAAALSAARNGVDTLLIEIMDIWVGYLRA